MSRKKSQTWWRQLPLPVLRLLSVVGLAILGLPGDGIQFASSATGSNRVAPLPQKRELVIL